MCLCARESMRVPGVTPCHAVMELYAPGHPCSGLSLPSGSLQAASHNGRRYDPEGALSVERGGLPDHASSRQSPCQPHSCLQPRSHPPTFLQKLWREFAAAMRVPTASPVRPRALSLACQFPAPLDCRLVWPVWPSRLPRLLPAARWGHCKESCMARFSSCQSLLQHMIHTGLDRSLATGAGR